MKIALVHGFCWPEVRRGAERYLDDLSWALADAGHAVTVITGTHGTFSADVDPEGRRVIRHRHRARGHLARIRVSPLDVFGALALPDLVRQRFDVVHALIPSAAVAARLAGQRTVYTALGHPTAEQFVRRFDRPLFDLACRRSSAVTALSESSAEQVEVLTGRLPQVVPPGVRMDRFPPNLSPRTGPLRILFCSDASDPRKGLSLLLQAFARLLEKRPEARLQLAGPGDAGEALAALGPGRTRVEAAIDNFGAGELSDLPRLYREASVTVLPARFEAFGLVLIESLSCGTPVVCTDDGGMTSIVTDDRIGLRVPPDSPSALANALNEVADLATRPGTPAACVAHASRWDWRGVVVGEHVRLYDAISRGAREAA